MTTILTRGGWVKTPNNPFDHGVRLCTKLLDNYQLPTKVQEEIQQDCTRKAVSPWMACNVFQSTLGFEKSINADIWKTIKYHLEQSMETDIALENFNSAISEYMNNQDEKSILSFSLCFEILENKHRKTRGKKDTNIKKLFNESILINKNIRPILKDLIVIDRGHVAHGKKPHKLSTGVRTMEEYIKAMAEYLSSYNDVTPSNKPAHKPA